MTTTSSDITRQVRMAVEANGAELAAGIDVDGIVGEIIDTYGLVSLGDEVHPADPGAPDVEEFWAIVQRHDATQA